VIIYPPKNVSLHNNIECNDNLSFKERSSFLRYFHIETINNSFDQKVKHRKISMIAGDVVTFLFINQSLGYFNSG